MLKSNLLNLLWNKIIQLLVATAYFQNSFDIMQIKSTQIRNQKIALIKTLRIYLRSKKLMKQYFFY